MFEKFLNLLKTPHNTSLIEAISEGYRICFLEGEEKTYDCPYPMEMLPEHLRECPIHRWRARTGIELVHKEPDTEEQKRIWDNWMLMTEEDKEISDEKSLELFGMTNEEHHDKIMSRAVMEGNDPLCGKKGSPNPYALVERIKKPDPYYDIAPHTIQQTSHLEKGNEKVLMEICNKLGITIQNIKDDYLTTNQHLPVFQYIEKLKGLDSWKSKAPYYDNDKDEYYGPENKKYAIPIDNKYRDNDASGHHSLT